MRIGIKHRGPRALLRLANRLPAALTEMEGVREQLSYLRKREALMDYPQFRQLGWPIGSGSVESANKLVVEARLKGAGMHWERKNVNPMLALRTGVCNDRWTESWQTGQRYQREQHHQRRLMRAKLRRQVALALEKPALPTSPPPQPALPPPSPSRSASPPAATLPGSSRPSAHHPWKRGPACLPPRFAKS